MTQKMLRLLAALLALAVLAAACGDDDDDTEAGGAEGGEGGDVSVSLITKDSTNPFFVAMQEGAREKAAELGIDLTVGSGQAEGDDQGQIDLIETAIADGHAGILITPMSVNVNDALDWLGGRVDGRPTVVVGYDARHHSKDFAADVARVVAVQGGRPLLVDQPAPTPVLARAVLDEGARTYEPLRPHDCRHIYAMLAERASLVRTKVQRAGLGHARLAQTLDYTDRETAFTTVEMRAIDGVLSPEAESMTVKQTG